MKPIEDIVRGLVVEMIAQRRSLVRS